MIEKQPQTKHFGKTMKRFAIAVSLCLAVFQIQAEGAKPPVHLAIIGLAHDAVGDLFSGHAIILRFNWLASWSPIRNWWHDTPGCLT